MKPVSKIDRYVIQQVIKRRQELHYTQADLAHALDVGRSFIQAVESNDTPKRYSLERLNEIAKVLQCSLHDFLPRDPL
jgi:transcriptional regulator with XRE-family HTH domain